MDAEAALLGQVVGSLHLHQFIKLKAVPGEFVVLSRAHFQILLLGVLGGQHHPQHRYGNTQVGADHAVVSQRLAAQSGAESTNAAAAHQQVLRQAQYQPGRQHHRHGCRHIEMAVIQRGKQGAQQQRGNQRQQQLPAPARGAVPLPAGVRPQPHDGYGHRHQRQEHGIEVGWTNRVFALSQGIHQQWKQRAEQHRQGGDQKHQVIEQQQAFPRPAAELDATLQGRGAQGVEGQRAPHHQAQEQQDIGAAGGVGGKGMD